MTDALRADSATLNDDDIIFNELGLSDELTRDDGYYAAIERDEAERGQAADWVDDVAPEPVPAPAPEVPVNTYGHTYDDPAGAAAYIAAGADEKARRMRARDWAEGEAQARETARLREAALAEMEPDIEAQDPLDEMQRMFGKLPAQLKPGQLRLVGGKEIAETEPGEDPFDFIWELEREVDRNGNPKPTFKATVENVEIILSRDPRIAGKMRFNRLALAPEIIEDVDFRTPGLLNLPLEKTLDNVYGSTEITDNYLGRLRTWIERRPTRTTEGRAGGYSIKLEKEDFIRALMNVAQHNEYHPIVELAKEKDWDGVDRLGAFPTEIMGIEPNAFTREAFKCWLTQIYYRSEEPGGDAQNLLVIQGKEGAGKNDMLKVIAGGVGRGYGELCSSAMRDENRSVEAMSGSCIIDMTEGNAFRAMKDDRKQKQFLSKQIDRVRLAYGRGTTNHRRQCGFVLTTNEEEVLPGVTGNRRPWVLRLPDRFRDGAWLDTDKVAEMRQQLWAQARHIYLEMRKERPVGQLRIGLSPEAKVIAYQKAEGARTATWEDTLLVHVDSVIKTPLTFDERERLKDEHMVTVHGHHYRRIWSRDMIRLGVVALVSEDPSFPVRELDRDANGNPLTKALQRLGYLEFRPAGMVPDGPKTRVKHMTIKDEAFAQSMME